MKQLINVEEEMGQLSLPYGEPLQKMLNKSFSLSREMMVKYISAGGDLRFN